MAVGGVTGDDGPDEAGQHESAERPPVEVEPAEIAGDPRRDRRDRERLEGHDRHVDRQPETQAGVAVHTRCCHALRCDVTVIPGTLGVIVTVLDEILMTKRAEVEGLRARAADLEAAAGAAPTTRDFVGALRRADDSLAVVAEIKRRSPSKGELAPDLVPADTARAYEIGGAACLSVLTDRAYFGGDLDDLRAARAATALPVLRKDFTIDAVQLHEARAAGADAVLLIVAALDDPLMRDLHDAATALGLAVLVEAHDEAELDRALALGPRVVGVNARDLGDFGEDLSVGERLAKRIPAEIVAVAESAIRSVDDARRMAAAGYDAVLVGEALVRAADPARLVRELAVVPRQNRS